MSHFLTFAAMAGCRWLAQQFRAPTRTSSHRTLNIGYCAATPDQSGRVFRDHPDAMIAGEFLEMLERDSDWCGFYEDIALKLLRLKSQHPDCDIYVHSPYVA